MSKLCPTPAVALAEVLFDGMAIMSGGFGLSGNPESLIPEIRKAGVSDLAGVPGVTVNRLCGSGLNAVGIAGQPIR